MSERQHRIMVTGGAGFVGSALVRRLLMSSDVNAVCVVDNLRNGKREFLPSDKRITLAEVDLRNANDLKEVIKDVRPEAVFHLAALHFIPYCNEHPAECLDVNVVGTENLLEACRQFPPERMVIASSAAVYPIWDGPCSEDTVPPGPTDVYGLSKWINEKQLELFAQRAATRCTAARLFNVYGPRETNPHVIPEILDQLVAGATELMLGNTAPKRDYIYVEDVAAALMALAAQNTASFQAVNVGTGVEYSVVELVEELCRHVPRKIKIGTDPKRVRASDRLHLVADNARLHNATGWKPQFDLVAGLEALWKYTTA